MSDVLKVSLYISQFLMWNLKNDIWLLKAENANQPQPFVSSTKYISDINVLNALLDHYKSNLKKLILELL